MTKETFRGTIKGKAKYAILNKSMPSYRSKLDTTLSKETESRITVLIEDKEELKKFSALLRELKVKAKVKTLDKDGEMITPQFSFKKLITTKDGITYELPRVVDKHGKAVVENVGNDSDVVVQFKARAYTDRLDGTTKHSLDLEAVQVQNLIPYVPDIPMLFESETETEQETNRPLDTF